MENQEKKVEVSSPEQVKTESKKSKKWLSPKNVRYAYWAGALILALLVGGFGVYSYQKKGTVTPDQSKQRVLDFIKEMGGSNIEVKEVKKENGLYRMTLNSQGQDMDVYVTLDGKLLFQQAMNIDDAISQKKEADAKKNVEIPKSTKPKVELFVMSYCPYGLQMERGMLPVVEALGDKIDFSLKFVSYTLHGQKEVDENVKQYCIQKTQPSKLDNYLKCFWKDSKGLSDACMKSSGVVASQVSACVADAKKQFTLTEKDFSIDKDLNTKYGVEGSPTLVINGVVSSAQRDSNSILNAVCGAFETKPDECAKQLSSTSPVAGFDDQASGSAANSAASCGN